jgi:hypothetical protein
MVDTGAGQLRIGLATQFRIDVTSDDDGAERRLRSAVLVRRLRTTLSGRFLDDRLSFAMQINTTAGNFELVDMWVDAELHSVVRLRVGQFKVPLDQYRQQSFTRLLLVDWARTTAWFGAERQFGVMVHDAATGRVDYRFGVFTGQNRRAGHAISLPQLYGEPVSNPSRVDGIGEVDEVHPELIGSLRFTSVGFSDSSLSDRVGGPLRTLFALSSAVDFDPEPGRDFRARFVGEAWAKVAHVSLQAIGYLGFVDGTTRDGLLPAVGANLQAAYRLSPSFEVAARYGVVPLSSALSDDARDRAADLVEAAPTPEEAASLTAQYADAGALRWEQELTVGGTWFVVGHGLKLQSDLGWIHQGRRDGDQDDFRARLMLQLAL